MYVRVLVVAVRHDRERLPARATSHDGDVTPRTLLALAVPLLLPARS